MKNVNARSKTGRWWQTPEGATRCHLHIPLVHAAAVMIDQDGNAFEVENVRTYDAGSGVTALFEIGAVTGKRIQAGSNPLSVSDTNPEVHVGADNLRATGRAAAVRRRGTADGAGRPGRRRYPTREATAETERSAGLGDDRGPARRRTPRRAGGSGRGWRRSDGSAEPHSATACSTTRYEATLLFETGYELEDQAASESRSRVRAPNTALEGSASGGSPEGATRCTLLGHAAAVMIDRDDRAVEVENVRAGGRSLRSTCNHLQVAVAAKPSRASPAVRHRAGNPGARSVGANVLPVGDTTGEVLGGDNLMAFLRVCAGSTPRMRYRSRPVGAARRLTSGARRRAWRRRDSWCALAAARSGQGPPRTGSADLDERIAGRRVQLRYW